MMPTLTDQLDNLARSNRLRIRSSASTSTPNPARRGVTSTMGAAGAEDTLASLGPESTVLNLRLKPRRGGEGARVTFIEDSALLEEFGGAAALLRFRI